MISPQTALVDIARLCTIGIGSTFEAELDDGTVFTLTIRDSESDVANGIISAKTPVALALLGAHKGESRTYKVEEHEKTVKVRRIVNTPTSTSVAPSREAAESLVEPITQHLRDHQTALDDWDYAGVARTLHPWVAIFNLEFKLQLPSYPVLRFASLRNAYATYLASRSEIGTKDNITFNTNRLGRDKALVLRILCHELTHLWQHYHGKPPKTNYHNSEFRSKSLKCGLIVDPAGCTCGHTQVFTEVLAKNGIHLKPLAAEMQRLNKAGVEKQSVKMKKWRCKCTIVRCATYLKAKCLRCEELFSRA